MIKGLGGLGNLAGLLMNPDELKAKMEAMQESLGRLRVEGSAGGGMVTVVASGQQKIVDCKIEPALLEGNDREMIEDLVVSAVNQALDKARQSAADEMGKATDGLNIPGLEDALAKFGDSNT